MVERGFRVFPPRPSKEIQRTLPQDTVSNKKDPVISQGLDYLCGAYRSRTDDLLTAREIASVTYPLEIRYITTAQDRKT